ncbi:MAG TPA: hypothetical protein PK078_04465 [Anaerolineales bacterium]|nr:hypothetical protein [Anaerolineales bacterium]
MSRRTYFILFLCGLILPTVIAFFQPKPGYLDSEYYFAGGVQLATGHGFNEPYLWNYLDGTRSLPHPSHTYWMPLSSIVAAIPMLITGLTTYAVARVPFILIGAAIVPLTAALSFAFSKKQDVAILSAMFSIFTVYNAPFIGVTDNFGLFMLFGVLYFLTATKLIEDPARSKYWPVLGLLAGLLSLSRSDGLLWLGMTFIFTLFRAPKTTFSKLLGYVVRNSIFALVGFLLIMLPWYVRNYNLFGTIMAPGGSRALWLENYDQTFIYPPEALSKESFLATGWTEILSDRLWALGNNLQSGFAAHGGIILFPFIVAGILYHRRDERVKLAWIAWLILLLVMTFLFPFAGARGAFFHAGAALQPMWWVVAPLGLDGILDSLRKRGWGDEQGRFIFRSALVLVTVILTFYVVYLRLFALGWGDGKMGYSDVEQFIVSHGARAQDVVIVLDAPGYYLDSGRSAVSIPYGGREAVLNVSRQFNAEYLVLEKEAAINDLKILIDSPEQNEHFTYLGTLDEAYIFKLNP